MGPQLGGPPPKQKNLIGKKFPRKKANLGMITYKPRKNGIFFNFQAPCGKKFGLLIKFPPGGLSYI